jgi:hypothetical protein
MLAAIGARDGNYYELFRQILVGSYARSSAGNGKK